MYTERSLDFENLPVGLLNATVMDYPFISSLTCMIQWKA